jgi:hypothetical protein
VTARQPTNGLRPVPHIDHVMVKLDPPGYQDVLESRFLADRFARLHEKHANSSLAGQYSTLGVAGQSTLVELFHAELRSSGLPSGVPLTGGLVFSFEEPGSSAAARDLMDASGEIRYHHELVTRTTEGTDQPRPWYQLISVDLGTASPFVLLLNEVTPEYFGAVGARPSADGTLRRRDYLDAVVGTDGGVTKLMRDIVGVTLLVHPQRVGPLSKVLGLFGYTATGHDDGLELRGPEMFLRLVVDESAAERISEVQIALAAQASEPMEHSFAGSARLVIDADATARWIFANTEQ